MSVERANVLIVGAGLAGARCAEALRAAGHDRRIVVLGDEPYPPYERPALSKELLTGTRSGPDLHLRDAGYWREHEIELVPGSRVQRIDLATREAMTSHRCFRFEHLVLATGLRARRIAAIPAGPGVHVLRTLGDAESLRTSLRPGAHLAVVGAGFVGLEVASSAVGLGLRVTVLEPAATPFASSLGVELGGRLGARARDAGVDLRLGAAAHSVEREPAGALRAVVLSDGTRLACDLLLVGVGAIPNTELVSGQLALAEDGGIPTDTAGRTSVPGVYACGDVASRARAEGTGTLRLEHWGAAATSARAVASAIVGAPLPAEGAPFFWSDLFGWRLQAIGLPSGRAAVEIEEDDGGLLARYEAGGRLVGAVAINRPRALQPLRRELADASSGLLVA